MVNKICEVAEHLNTILKSSLVVQNEPMCVHTTFKIGGPADVCVFPSSKDDLVQVLNYCVNEHIDYFIVGNGSDLLVSDKGIRGVVIVLRENFSDIKIEDNCITAQAGALLHDVAIAAADVGLSGLEPLWGIPATVGGACFMNAGAYGSETSVVLKSLCAWDPRDGQVHNFCNDELEMGYRKTRVRDDGLVVLDATFCLNRADSDDIRKDMNNYQLRREEKQPLNLPSAGSTFKRPEGYFAGKLIMDSGLRGVRIGGAQVSTKHCGFVVNIDNATASDVDKLICHIQQEVQRRFGVHLECEVLHVGEF